jgi:hypothetical protein
MLRPTLVEVREIAKSSSRTQTTSASENRLDPRLQHGYELLFKPWMALEPRLIARRGMWQRNVLWSVFPPGLGRFGQRWFVAASQKMALGILTDEQRQFNPRQLGQQMIEPQRRAFTARRHITAVTSARVAITHGNDGDARLVIKDVLVHAHPGAQSLATGVAPWNAGRVHAHAGRLANDEDAGRLTGAQHRARTERQMRFARAAVSHRCQQRLERAIVFLGHNSFLTCGEYSTIPDAELHAGKRYLLDGRIKEA